MIVEESFENVINVYVDGYVFTADRDKREWNFGDGNDNPDHIREQASRRGMTADEFMQHYRQICNAAAGWKDARWKYRYNVVAMEGSGNQMLQEIFDRVEDMITKSRAEKDKEKCELMLKTYASRPMIRTNGLKIMKYIVDAESENRRRIVYQMNELSPFEIEALIPKQVLHNTIHRKV